MYDLKTATGSDLYGDYTKVTCGRFEDTYRRAGKYWSRQSRTEWTSRFRTGMPTDAEALAELNAFEKTL